MAWFPASSFLCFPQEREGPGVEEVVLLHLAPCTGGVLGSCCSLRLVSVCIQAMTESPC